MSLTGPFDDHQVIVSVELLKLLYWLIEHEQETLKRLLSRALDKNTGNEPWDMLTTSEELKGQVSHMFMLLETLLHEVASEQLQEQQLERLLLPAIDHIDNTQCDKETISRSIAKATASVEKNANANPREVLYRELLKHWHPEKQIIN